MALNIGDKVVYINNMAYDENEQLLKRPIGIVRGIFSDCVVCNWVSKLDSFYWCVPISYVRLYRENK
jgi:hypothetical protein